MAAKKQIAKDSSSNSLDQALDTINKLFGEGAVIHGDNIPVVPRRSSGVPSLDAALGGGYGNGRIVEIYGPESSGKTMLSIMALAKAQQDEPDKKVAIVDAEHALDPTFCKMLGLDMSKVIFSQPSCGEEAFEILGLLAASEGVSFILVDSVTALLPKSELEGDMDASAMGSQARMMSKGLRKFTGLISKSGATVIFINQLREKLGVMWGTNETTTGGNALKFYATQRIDVRRRMIKDENYNEVTCKIIKNKLGRPFLKTTFKNYQNVGVSIGEDIIGMALERGIVKQAGSWFSYNEAKLAQGLANTVEAICSNVELFQEIESKVKESVYAEQQ